MKLSIVIACYIILSASVFAQMQSDSSDKKWSIVKPKIDADIINMQRTLVNIPKDSVINNFLRNTGSYKCRIDSIYFTGADASAFSIVSGLPVYTIDTKESKDTEIRFMPSEARIYNADIIIQTQSEKLIRNITGEGVEPKIAVVNNLIDFGTITSGSPGKDTNEVTIENISNTSVQINKIENVGPNKSDFSFIQPTTMPYTLNAGDKLRLDMHFGTNAIGRTATKLQFNYDGQIKPAEVILFGKAIGGLVKIDDDSAFAGDKRKLKLILMNKIVSPSGDNVVLPFRAKIKYNPTLLTITELHATKSVSKKYEICDIKSYWNMKDTILNEFAYIAGLGDAVSSNLILDEFFWLDADGKDINIEVDKLNGKFTLLGICHEGGTRLINPNANLGIRNIATNATKTKLIITAIVSEPDSKIKLFTLDGRLIKEIDCYVDKTNPQDFAIDITDIPGGMYILEFQSATFSQIEKIIIEK